MDLDSDIKDMDSLAKGYAIKDIMVDCPSYLEIKEYINSLYLRKDNLYVVQMFDSIVKAILLKVTNDRAICEIIDSIRDAINELETYFDSKWKDSKNKNDYKRGEIKKYLTSLIDGPDIDTSIYGWKEFIRKKLTYAKYEDSFTEEGVFDKYQTQLNLGKLPMRDYVFMNSVTKEDLVNQFKDLINGSGMELTKADLRVKRELLDKSGNLVLNIGDLIEVKYKNFKLVDTLGEFYSLSKGHLTVDKASQLDPSISLGRKNSKGHYLITDIFSLNPSLFNKYNEIIDIFYNILINSDKGNEILDKIKGSFEGIMFKDNKYIKSEDLVIKWSLKGQRKNENRLAITHEPLSNAKVYRYIDDPINPHFRDPKIY